VMKSYKVADEEGDLHDKSNADSDDF